MHTTMAIRANTLKAAATHAPVVTERIIALVTQNKGIRLPRDWLLCDVF